MISKISFRGPAEWSVYILRCADGTFYTGIAKDVDLRLKKHNDGKGAAYTRSRRPVEVLHRQEGFTRSAALVREAALKSLPRKKKVDFVAGKFSFRRKKLRASRP